MKKETAAKAKRVAAALTIGAAMSLSIVAQDRSGYILSTGRSGYITSTGRTDTQTTAEAATETTDGTGTLGSGNLTVSDDGGIVVTLWNWLGEII
ncbi:MAG TPA: hypothetical protein VF692_10875 [Pyrinomonadaceae bacterium]|jgi:hypothetical protein